LGIFSFSPSPSRNVTTQLYYTNTMRLIVNPLCIALLHCSHLRRLPSVRTWFSCWWILWQRTFDVRPSRKIIILILPNYYNPTVLLIFLNNTNFAKLIFVLNIITLELHIYICTRTNVYLSVLMLRNYKVYYNNVNNFKLY